MSYTEAQLRDLLHQAGHMPYGPGQIALVEQVITQADAQRLPTLAFLARMYGTEAYIFGGEKVRAFPTFAWCVAEYDRDPQTYAEHQYWLLWQFKYVISAMTSFPEIPLDRIYAVLDDMQRRWTETGHSLHAVYAYRHEVAAHIGDREAAQEYYLRWCAAPRDRLSDCAACDSASKAGWLARCDQDEEAIALGETVLSGEVTCDAQPRSILTTLMFPYLHTGRLDQARDAHRRAYRLHRSRLASLSSIGSHIEFCAQTGNEARAVEMVERHLGWLDKAPSPWAAMAFAASAAHALRRAQERHHGVLTLHRPEHEDRPAGPVAALDLADELANQATELAARFDQRNGTSRVGELVRDWLVAEPVVEYLPLSPTALRPSTVVAVGDPPASPPAATASPPAASPPPPAAQEPAAPPPPPAVWPPVPVEVPETAGPDELLDLIDEYRDARDDARADAALAAFETRYGGLTLTTHQRARLADARARQTSTSDEEAIALWRTAAADYAASGDPDREQRALARIGNTLCRTGRAEEGLPIIRAATERLLASPDPGIRVEAAIRLAGCLSQLGDPRSALAALENPDLRAEEAPIRVRAEHATELAYTHLRLGHLDKVLDIAPLAITLAEEVGDKNWLSVGHAALAVALSQRRQYQEALRHIDAAIAHQTDEEVLSGLRQVRAAIVPHTDQAASAIDDLIERIADCTARGDHATAADLRHRLAVAYLKINRLLDAAEVAEEELAYRLADQGRLNGKSHVLVRELLVTIYQRLGQPAEAVKQLDILINEVGRMDLRPTMAELAQRAGEILYDAEEFEAAAARFLAAADAFADSDQPVRELHNRWRQADALRRAVRTAESLEALAAADRVAARLTGDDPAARWELAALDFSAARVLRAAKRLPEAEQRAERAIQASAEFNDPKFTADSYQVLSAILLDLGRPAEAEAAIQQALAVLPDGADRQPYLEVLEIARQAKGRLDQAEETR